MKHIKTVLFLLSLQYSVITTTQEEQEPATLKAQLASYFENKIKNPALTSFYITQAKCAYLWSTMVTAPVSRTWKKLDKETQKTLILASILSVYYAIHILKYPYSSFHIAEDKTQMNIKDQILGGTLTGTLGIFLATAALAISSLLKIKIEGSDLTKFLLLES